MTAVSETTPASAPVGGHILANVTDKITGKITGETTGEITGKITDDATRPGPATTALDKALAALQAGRMIVLVDDEDRENEGDLVIAAQFASTEAVNFMATHGRGLICLVLEGAQVDRLGLQPMVAENRARRSTAFTVSIEAKDGISTGISARDRGYTMRLAASSGVRPGDIVSPGHVFPLRAADGGVLVRNGHTEGAADLVRLAGLPPGAVICEIMREDGEMARRADLAEFARRHGLEMLSIGEIVAWRSGAEG